MDAYQEYKNLNQHRYAIVDHTLRDTLDPNWEQAVIAPAFLDNDTGRCPVLVDTHSIDDIQKDTIFNTFTSATKEAKETLFSLLLASEKPIEAIAKHLALRLKIKQESVRRPQQFRYFDPLTFIQLPRLFGDAGMAWLMGPVSSIMVPCVGEFTVYPKPAAQAGFSLNAQYIAGLHRISTINQVQNDIDIPDVPNQQAWLTRADEIHGYINRARQHTITDMASTVLFCKHALLHHPKFDEHPKVQSILTALQSTNGDVGDEYIFLAQALTAEDWQQIANELSAQITDDVLAI
jgi:hypothetical protein